jgi:F0F1-type ATP synthase assembly protein I
LDQAPRRPPTQSPKKSDLGGLYHGFQFALTALFGLAVGYWMDQHYLPMPLGTLGGLMVGSCVGMYVLAKALK